MVNPQPTPAIIGELISDHELGTEHQLTARMEEFALNYAQTRDCGASYRLAYNCRPQTAQHVVRGEGWRLLQHPRVKQRIKELTDAAALAVEFGIPDVMRVWLEMATADPNELISYRIGCCRYCHGADHGYQWREREYFEELARVEAFNRGTVASAHLPLPDVAGGFGFNHTVEPSQDCPECHGEGVGRVVACDTTKLTPGARLLYGGVRQKRGGDFEIIIASQQKAWENFTRMLGGFDDQVKVSGSLTLVAQSVNLAKSDPREATRVYEQVIRGMAIGNGPNDKPAGKILESP